MAIIVVLILISLTIGISFLMTFLWNLKSGQYEDTYSPSVRMLFDSTTEKKQSGDKLSKKAETNITSSNA